MRGWLGMWGERAAGIGAVAVIAVQAMGSVPALMALQARPAGVRFDSGYLRSTSSGDALRGRVGRARKEDWIPAEDAGMTEGRWSRDARTMVVDVATRRRDRGNSGVSHSRGVRLRILDAGAH